MTRSAFPRLIGWLRAGISDVGGTREDRQAAALGTDLARVSNPSIPPLEKYNSGTRFRCFKVGLRRRTPASVEAEAGFAAGRGGGGARIK